MMGSRAHVLRWLCLCLLAGACQACAGSVSQVAKERPWTPETLYPLAEGHAWSYDVDSGDGDPVLAVTRVVTATPQAAIVEVGKEQTVYERRPDGWYRPAKGGYLLRTPLAVGATWESGQDLSARLVRAVDRIETPAGRFSHCAEVEELQSRSGTRIWTTYCPDVGPVRVISELVVRGQTLRVTAILRGYAVAVSTRADPQP